MIAIKVPPLGESITEATVSRWLKKEGDTIAAGETLVELETDKITVEVPALKAGRLASRAKGEGDVVAVNDTLGELDESGAGAEVVAPTVAAPAAAATAAAAVADVRSTPAARRLADEAGVELSTVAGTGRGGVVSKPDVIAAISTPAAAAPSRQSERASSKVKP